MTILKMQGRHHRGIIALAEALPDWFDEDARKRSIPIDIRIHRGFAALEQDRLIGFVTFTSEYGFGRISWIGVDPKSHRKGIGRKLVDAVEQAMRQAGVKEVRVETVGWSEPPHEPYAKTLLFYEALGFKVRKQGEVCEGAGYRWRMYDLSKQLA